MRTTLREVFDFYESATSAVERAASTVQLLRALSGIDGVSYKGIYLGDIWGLVESEICDGCAADR